jgi:hypothetical protein
MDLEFSLESKGTPGKSKCLVTSRSLRQALLGPLSRLGIATAKEIGYLGVVLCRSGGRSVKAGKRMQGLRKRVSRMIQLGLNAKGGKVRQGMRKVVRAGLMAGLKYGIKSKGVGHTRLQQYRQQLTKALGKRRRQSLSLFLALNGMEPTHETTAEPMVAWAQAIWDGTANRFDLQQDWRTQMSRRLKPVNFNPAGPAGAVIQAAERIGWTWPAWSVLRTAEGAVLDMEKVCPQDIKAMVQLASEKAHWSKWAASSEEWKDLMQGPWLQPVMQVLGRRKQAGWTARHTAVAKNIVAGQLPRYDCGLTTSPLCQ